MKRLHLFLVCLSLLCYSIVNAQWKSHLGVNAPFGQGYSIYKIAYDNNNQKLWIFSSKFTVGHVLWEYTETNGWVNKPTPPFSDNESVVSVKFRNGTGWCLTTKKLYKFENDNWNTITFPSSYSLAQTIDGLYIDNQNVWFAGGDGGKGISKYDGTKWVNYNSLNTPNFKQDIGISSISMDEEDSVIWIATNCFGSFSGVYSFDIKNDNWHLYDNIDPKYGCVHGVIPLKNGAIVGTCNFSSIRVLDDNGVFTQSIDGNLSAGCVSEMEADPDNENWAWVMSDWKLFHFKDTLHYEFFDTTNSLIKGLFFYSISTQENYNDSSRIWVITSSGLFSYTYSSKDPHTAINRAISPINAIEIYPNPSKGVYNLSSITEPSKFSFEVRNITGQSVNYQFTKTTSGASITISELPAGIYTLRISDGASKVFRKLILTE